MPPHLINYAKNNIYKIVCKDENVKDLYVGRTCDITRRKYQHKHNCNNKKKSYLYSCINLNGGWMNWEFVVIEQYPCDNSIDAGRREKYWIHLLMATLNINGLFSEDDNTNSEYKKKWYFENQLKIRKHQAEYKQSREYINEYYKFNVPLNFEHENYKNIQVDLENKDNNPQWIKENMKNAKYAK